MIYSYTHTNGCAIKNQPFTTIILLHITEFVLRINIGNAATLDDADLADIIRKAADYVERMGTEYNRSYNVRDLNGNTVGSLGRYLTEEEDSDLTCTQQDHDEAEWGPGPDKCDRCGKPQNLEEES